MNYYKRHLGDYARDTGHLTALEHGVYNLLLDWYYINEKPIPPDRAIKIARGNPEETQSVLSEYFKLTPEGWVHGYADKEIAKYRVKADRNRDVGKLGGRPAKSAACETQNPEITQMVSDQNPEITLATNPLIHYSKKEQDQKTLRPSLREDADPALGELLVGIPADLLRDYKKVRKAKKLAFTVRAVRGLIEAGRRGGKSLREVMEICCAESWGGYNHTWPRSSDRGMVAVGSHLPARDLPKTVGGILALEAMKS
jgi:uncharacterized protein YdaU (DUF1376 family)